MQPAGGEENAGEDELIQQRQNLLLTLNSQVRLRNLERTLMKMADTIRKGSGTNQSYLGILIGLLFIKRASDQFSDERTLLVQRLIDEGVEEDIAEGEADISENYRTSILFCPPEARWTRRDGQGICQIQQPGLGNRLREAVTELERNNPRMGRALSTSVDFCAIEGNKRILSDADYKSLVDEMSFDLSDGSLEFPDIMGAAYEFTVRYFTQHEEGRDAGAHYTPRELVTLLVRVLDPQNGDSVYDPSSGSGGMLIYSKNHVDRIERNSENLWLYGQELKGTSWALSVINMMFHGVVNFKLEQGDTLVSPHHRRVGGGIRRFNKIIANMPFSMRYNRDQLVLKGRFPYGYPPKKKADLLFVQHMLSSLKSGGKIATICSSGILFRGNEELVIRRGFLERDLVEAVISLPKNLFQNTSTTVSILVLRRRGTEKEPNMQNHVLFINAENEFGDDRTKQNYLRPQDVEKIHRHYAQCLDLENYSRLVHIDEIRGKNHSLNVREYVDSSTPPHPQNVRAHISGCVPRNEVEEARFILERVGVDMDSLFCERDAEDFDFTEAVISRRSISELVNAMTAVQTYHDNLVSNLYQWWQANREVVIAFEHGEINIRDLEANLLENLIECFTEQSILDDLEIRGFFALWCDQIRYDLETLSTTGWVGIIRSGASTYLTAVKEKSTLHDLEILIERALLPDRPVRIAEIELALREYEEQCMVLDYGGDWADIEEEELKEMEKYSITQRRRAAELRGEISVARRENEENVEGLQAQAVEVKTWRDEYKRIDELRKAQKRAIKQMNHPDTIQNELLDSIDALQDTEIQEIVLDIFYQQISTQIISASLTKRNQCISLIESMWDRYATNLRALEENGVQAKDTLDRYLEVLGYDS